MKLWSGAFARTAADLPTSIVDLRGFDSSINLKLTGGIPRAIGNLPESLSQAMLVGIMLVGKSVAGRQSSGSSVLTDQQRRANEFFGGLLRTSCLMA